MSEKLAILVMSTVLAFVMFAVGVGVTYGLWRVMQ
jgi:hypothetical protein